jgi:hypothetical protein
MGQLRVITEPIQVWNNLQNLIGGPKLITTKARSLEQYPQLILIVASKVIQCEIYTTMIDICGTTKTQSRLGTKPLGIRTQE